MGVTAGERILQLAVLLLPADLRVTRREEWLADLACCEELEIPPRQILLGAVLSAARARVTRPHRTTEPGSRSLMTESAKSALRLVLYAGWVAIAGIVTWVMAVQTTAYLATGLGPGYTFAAGGPSFDLSIPMLVVAVVVLAAGIAFGIRSFYVSFLAPPRAAERSELLPGV